MSDAPKNFQEWWFVYNENHNHDIGGREWLAAYAAWHYALRTVGANSSVLDEMMAKLEARPDAVQPTELTQEQVDALCSGDD